MQFIRKNLKPILMVIVIAFIVSIFYGLGQYRSSGSRNQNIGNLIAEVNDIGIGYYQWQNAFTNFISRYDNQALSNMTDETLAMIKNSVTEQLINSTLLSQLAKNQNIPVDDKEINEEIDKIKANFDSENEFNEALKRNSLTINQLKDDITNQKMIEKVIQQEYDKIEITEEEMAQYYEENKDTFFQPEKRKISHILVDTEEEAKNILLQLKDGIADFSKLAQEKSTCPSSEKGGDLGYITRGQMVKEFEDVAFNLEIGEMSDIVSTDFGFHIIKCDDIQQEHQLTFEEAKENIKNILTYQKQNESIETLLTQLRENANIKIHYDFTSEIKTEVSTENQDQNIPAETEKNSSTEEAQETVQ
ncbi:MAG: SurA N-terminal domain-containing protein [Candidatus Atribacteria bacterium]|nr:SurA N-terminal domain-containing protein [Candidatus Atribacteria bacterium]